MSDDIDGHDLMIEVTRAINAVAQGRSVDLAALRRVASEVNERETLLIERARDRLSAGDLHAVETVLVSVRRVPAILDALERGDIESALIRFRRAIGLPLSGDDEEPA